MTGPDGQHERWEELVVGHVLGALEPDEEQLLLDHLAHCDRCARLTSDHARTAADLAYLSDDVEAPPQLWGRIHAALGDAGPESAGAISSAQVGGPARRRGAGRFPRRATAHRRGVMAVAAAAAVVVGIGTWQAVDQLGAGRHRPAPVAGCLRSVGCQVVQLAGPDAHAALLIRGERVQVIPTGLSTLPAGMTYVLWQLPAGGPATGVAAFRVGGHDAVAVDAGLPRSLGDTTAFALSRERGGTIPAHPSSTVATGSLRATGSGNA